MHLKRKLPWILTGKSLLAITAISMVALGLVTYTQSVTINFNAFFVQGVITQTWGMTSSNGTRYLPGAQNGAFIQGTPGTGNTTSYAFLTQSTGRGYVKVGLASAVPTADFQTFRIFVLTWNSSSWNNATMYTTSAFTTVLSGGIDGTTASTVGYVHVSGGTQIFYAIEITYTLTATPSGSTTATFNYTPNLS